MKIVEQTIVSVEIEGKRIEFPDKDSAEETMGVMKALGKFISEGQEVPAARALKKYFEKNAKQAPEPPKRKRTPKASKPEPEKSGKTPPPPAKEVGKKDAGESGSDKKEASGKPKATRNVLPNPPGFTRDTDPKTGKPQRGRAPNAEKVAWAEKHAGDTEVQKWAEANDVKLPEPAPSSKPPAPKPLAPKPPAPESGNKPPAPPSDGFGPPPGPPPAL